MQRVYSGDGRITLDIRDLARKKGENMKKIWITLILTLTFLMTVSGCVSNTSATDITSPASASATTSLESSETAAIATPTPTPATLEAVVLLPLPATYSVLYDGTKLYTDGSRTVVLKVLAKGDTVIITGTAGRYGVTADGSYINLYIMYLVVVTPTPEPATTTPAETSAVPMDPTVATTKPPTSPTVTTTVNSDDPSVTKAPNTWATSPFVTPPTETSPPVCAYYPDLARQVLILVNQARTDAGSPELAWNDTLSAASDVRAKEIVNYFAHTRPDGTSCVTASNGLAYGENLARGNGIVTAQYVFDAWMGDEGHKDNILYYNYTITAISCYCVNGVYYWAEEFG